MEYPLLHEQEDKKQSGSAYYTTAKVRLQRVWSWLPRVWSWLPRVWNSGNTLLGLVGAAGGRAAWSRDDLMLEVSGGWLIGLLSRAGWASAITLGDVVLYAGRELVPLLHEHEMVHVRQGRLWGPFFLPAYVLESAWQWLRTGEGYRNNRFEVAAYAVAEAGFS